jgi:pimeloyl-ACP methyl ester carboxylesterase
MEPRFVQANGLRFAYLEAGRGPLVLLVHGFPDTAYTWDRAMPALAAAGFRAVAPFTRGYHPTEIPAVGPFDAATLGRDVLAWIDALAEPDAVGQRSAIVVGHDFGAAAAFSATAQGPERMRLLVTMASPHPASIRPSPRLVWAMRHMFVLGLPGGPARLRKANFAYIDRLWRRWSPAWRDVPETETAQVKQAFAHPGSVEAACAYYRAMFTLRPPASLRQPVGVPAVAFAGQHDKIMSPRAFERARRWYSSSYEVIQVPGGHFMHREHPDVFVPELVRVVREHDSRARAAS